MDDLLKDNHLNSIALMDDLVKDFYLTSFALIDDLSKDCYLISFGKMDDLVKDFYLFRPDGLFVRGLLLASSVKMNHLSNMSRDA